MTLDEAIALLPATDTIPVYHEAPKPQFREDTARDEVLFLINKSDKRGMWDGQVGEMLIILVDWKLLFIDIGRMKQDERSPK